MGGFSFSWAWPRPRPTSNINHQTITQSIDQSVSNQSKFATINCLSMYQSIDQSINLGPSESLLCLRCSLHFGHSRGSNLGFATLSLTALENSPQPPGASESLLFLRFSLHFGHSRGVEPRVCNTDLVRHWKFPTAAWPFRIVAFPKVFLAFWPFKGGRT